MSALETSIIDHIKAQRCSQCIADNGGDSQTTTTDLIV